MNNQKLYKDCLLRAEGRLKGFLRYLQIEVPRVHDVSAVLEENADKLPASVKKVLHELVDISQDPGRDRELAFCGSEDVTPHEFYEKKHAAAAKEKANKVVLICRKGASL